MTVRLSKADFDMIAAHAKAVLPNEACGLIAGTIAGDIKMVERVYLLDNTDQSPEHFTIEPKAQLAAVRDMRARRLVLLGNFHSHPTTKARPSEEDIRLAYNPQFSYLILSLSEGLPILNAFSIINKQVTLENLLIF